MNPTQTTASDYNAFCKFARIPSNLWQASRDQIPDSCKHKDLIFRYTESISRHIQTGQGLWLHGDYGSGKSAIACICLKAAFNSKHVGFWVWAKDIAGLKVTATTFNERETVYEHLATTDLLVIDEFQIRREIQAQEIAIEDVVRARIGEKKATIVTTNLALKTPQGEKYPSLQASFPSLYSVIQEALYPIKIEGHDFRKNQGGLTGGSL